MNMLSNMCLFLFKVQTFIWVLCIIGILIGLIMKKKRLAISSLKILIVILILEYPVSKLYSHSTKSAINSIIVESMILFNSNDIKDSKSLLTSSIDKFTLSENVIQLENALTTINILEEANTLLCARNYVDAQKLYKEALRYNINTDDINSKLDNINNLMTENIVIDEEVAAKSENNFNNENYGRAPLHEVYVESTESNNTEDYIPSGSVGISTTGGSIVESTSNKPNLSNYKNAIGNLYTGVTMYTVIDNEIVPVYLVLDKKNNVALDDGTLLESGVLVMEPDTGSCYWLDVKQLITLSSNEIGIRYYVKKDDPYLPN